MNGDTKNALSMAPANGYLRSTRAEACSGAVRHTCCGPRRPRPEARPAIAAQVEAGRVEHVSERPQVRDQGDAPALGVLARARRWTADRRRRRAPGRQVVGVAERRRGPAVATEQAQPAVERIQLIEVERGIPDGVLEAVADRARAAVADGALEEVRPHAATSTTASRTIAAASKPERQPSSWNP